MSVRSSVILTFVWNLSLLWSITAFVRADGHSAVAGITSQCGSFCDSTGRFHPRFQCRPNVERCCGTFRWRYCCAYSVSNSGSGRGGADLHPRDVGVFGRALLYSRRLADDSPCSPSSSPSRSVRNDDDGRRQVYLGSHRQSRDAEDDYSTSSFSSTVKHSLFTTSSPTAAIPSKDCGSYCGSDGWQDRQRCSLANLYCCGTYNNRKCCSDPEQYNESLSVDSDISGNCSSTFGWYLQWWYIIVPTVVLSILLVTMALCYVCRYHGRFGRHPTSRGSGSSYQRRHGERTAGDPASPEPPSTRDFDPTSSFAFEPPSYESLPKDPPTYTEIYLVDDSGQQVTTATTTYDNSTFVLDDTSSLPEQSTAADVNDSTFSNDVIHDVFPEPDYPPPSPAPPYSATVADHTSP